MPPLSGNIALRALAAIPGARPRRLAGLNDVRPLGDLEPALALQVLREGGDELLGLDILHRFHLVPGVRPGRGAILDVWTIRVSAHCIHIVPRVCPGPM